MSIVLDLQSWAVLLLGITLLPLVQQVKHRPAAKLGQAEWFTALQSVFLTAGQHVRLEDRHGWLPATALEQVDWIAAGRLDTAGTAGLSRTQLVS